MSAGDAGQVSGPQKMQHIVDRNQEVLNNFIKAIEELAILRDNLLKKEVRATVRLISADFGFEVPGQSSNGLQEQTK